MLGHVNHVTPGLVWAAQDGLILCGRLQDCSVHLQARWEKIHQLREIFDVFYPKQYVYFSASDLRINSFSSLGIMYFIGVSSEFLKDIVTT